MKVEKIYNHVHKTEPDKIFDRFKVAVGFIFGSGITAIIFLVTSKL